MLTVKENERMTQVGPGTPMGDLMRRYWQPVAAAVELEQNPVKQVRLLGEDMVLYKDRRGRYGVIDNVCPHRRISLAYGIPEEDGLRCPYHGWMFDQTGQCLEMPAESPESTFPSRVQIRAYPAQELSGLIFIYMGPQPAPLLPRWDLFAWDHVLRDVGTAVLPCNYLQVMENSMDPTHTEWLHTAFANYVLEKLGRSDLQRLAYRLGDGANSGLNIGNSHEKIGFDEFQHGIIKRRVVAGRTESDPEWRIGHPVVFPNILRIGINFQYRVPIDDTHTLHVWFSAYPQDPDAYIPKQETVPHYTVPLPIDGNGQADWGLMDNNSGQDIMAWITQGPVSDRSQEKLGESDKGIIMYRRMLRQQMAIIEDGGEPMNVFRDPASNECVDLPWEGREDPWGFVSRSLIRRTGSAGKYSPVLRDMVQALEPERPLDQPVF